MTNDDGDDDTTPTTSVANTCADDGSFTITANADPALNGCFQDTGATNDVGGAGVYYSVSGTMTESEIGVLAFLTDDGDVSLRGGACLLLRIRRITSVKPTTY